MARLRLFDRVYGERPDGVDAPFVEVPLACGAAGVFSGSGSFGPHWDLMTQCLSEYAESPLKWEKRLSGEAVPANGERLFQYSNPKKRRPPA
jgi:hypothetical protein